MSVDKRSLQRLRVSHSRACRVAATCSEQTWPPTGYMCNPLDQPSCLSIRHYVDRTIQCSSLIWSCELTGRSGLTYREAVDSEAEAKRQIESFPDALRRAVLFLASQVRRNGIGLLVEDVFAFYRERYVEGEDLELRFQDQK